MHQILLRPVPNQATGQARGPISGLEREPLEATLRAARESGVRGLDATALGPRDLALLGRVLAALPGPSASGPGTSGPGRGRGAGIWEVHLGLGATGMVTGLDSDLDYDLDSGRQSDVDWTSHRAVVSALEERFNHLGRARAHALHLFGPGIVEAWPRGLGRTLQGLAATGLVARVGLAAHTPEQARRILDLEGMDRLRPLIRVRAGVLDHAMEEAGIPDLARERGARLLVEDVFLSGLLLCSPGRPGLGPAGELLALLDREAEAMGLERVSLVLGYLRQALPGAFWSLEAPGPELVRHVAEVLERRPPPELAERVRLVLRRAGQELSDRKGEH